MAGVVGFVLVIAALVTYLAYVARSDVPRWGADAEHAWDSQVGDALQRLDRAAAAGLGSDASTTVALPAPPEPQAFDVPLVARTQASPPSGSLSFQPDCGGLVATHDAGGTSVPDIASGAHGCLVFREQGTYSASYGYRAEFGGLLRVERDRAFVVAGPPLSLQNAGARYVVGVTFIELRGASNSEAIGGQGIPVDLVPHPAEAETGATENAASANWTFETPYPSAWKTWFDGQLGQASFDPALNYACVAGDARCPDLQPNEVRVVLGGPTASASTPDLALSVSYGRYDATLR